MPPRSLQNRILLGFFVVVTVILTAGGFVIYPVIERHLRAEYDALLLDRLDFYESTSRLYQQRGMVMVGWRITEPEWRRIEKKNPDLVYLCWAQSKRPVHVPSALNGRPLPLPEATQGGAPVFMDHTLWDGRSARLVSRVFLPPREPDVPADPPNPVQLVVGRDTLAVTNTLARMQSFLIKMGLGVLSAVLLGSMIILRRGVKPVKSLTHQIEVMPLADEGSRFSLPGAPTEIQPVVTRLNALMDRVGAAIEHERQFASNAAHELRNPLAAIRSTIEVALSRTRKPAEYEETLENIWQSQQGMQRVVDHLLLLARLESGHQHSEFPAEPAVFGRLLKKSWRGCIDLAEERGLRVTWHVEHADTEIVTVLSLVEIVLSNLLGNAVNYTPAGGEVHIHATVAGGQCRIAVENTNPGLPADALEKTFTPFWRYDPNASGHRGNAGIGLALCRRIAITLGGSMEAGLTPEGLVRYTVTLPVTVNPPGNRPQTEAAANAAGTPENRTHPQHS